MVDWVHLFDVEVNKFGKVRHYVTKKIKRIYTTVGGYKILNVKDKDNWKTIGLHRLVALAFIGPCPSGKEVNHKDLDITNNFYKNLEYLTRKQNIEYSVVRGSYKNKLTCKGESHGRSKLNWNKVIDLRWLYSTGLFLQKELSKAFKVHNSIISKILTNKIWIENA